MRGQRTILSLLVMLLSVGSVGVENVSAQGPRREPSQSPPPAYYPPMQRMQWGLGVGVNIPFDVTEKLLTVSPSLHGMFLYQLDPAMKFEADLGYWFLQAAEKDAHDPSLLTLTGGFRYYFNYAAAPDAGPHLDAGLGLYHFSAWDHDVHGIAVSDEAHNKIGFYAGLGFAHVPFDATVRVHKSIFHADDFWSVGVTVRYFFFSPYP